KPDSREIGFGLGSADRIRDVDRGGPARKGVGKEIPEHAAEAALELPDDRARKAGSTHKLRSPKAREPVVEAGCHIGQRLVAEEPKIDVGRLEILSDLLQIGPSLECIPRREVNIDRSRLKRR